LPPQRSITAPDLAALAFQVLVEFVAYRHLSNDLPIDLRHEERRANPFRMWVAPGCLLVEQIEVVGECCGAGLGPAGT
jgi:hypothetical protein